MSQRYVSGRMLLFVFFFSSRRRHTRFDCDWSSDVCSSDLVGRPSPSLNARLRAWYGRRFGPNYLLPLLLREEGQEVKGYMDLHKEVSFDDAREVSLKLAKESAAHAETLAGLAGRAAEPWHKTG